MYLYNIRIKKLCIKIYITSINKIYSSKTLNETFIILIKLIIIEIINSAFIITINAVFNFIQVINGVFNVIEVFYNKCNICFNT